MNTEEGEVLSYEKGGIQKDIKSWGDSLASCRFDRWFRPATPLYPDLFSYAASEYPSDALRRKMGRDVVTATV